MKSYLLKLSALVFLAGCAAAPTTAPVPTGEAVTIQKMVSDTRGRPYECVNYESATDTCEGIAKRTVRGDRIYYDIRMLVPGPRFDYINVSVTANFKIQGNRYCGNMRNANVTAKGNINVSEKSVLEEVILAHMISIGDICGYYVRDNAGRYTSITTDTSGRIIPGGVEKIWFFSKPKKLRIAV